MRIEPIILAGGWPLNSRDKILRSVILVLLFMGGVLAVHSNDLVSWLVAAVGPALGVHSVTAHNGASIDSAIYRFGGGSGKFVAALNQYLTVPDSVDWNFGAGDFTVDFWVRFNSLPPNEGDQQQLLAQDDSVQASYNLDIYLQKTAGILNWHIYADNNGTAVIGAADGGAIFAASPALAINTWYHIAVVRSGRTVYFFQDGTSLGTTSITGSGSLPDLNGNLLIGIQEQYNGTHSLGFDGWLDEFRISKGIARWTSTIFTLPSAEYTPDKYTVLLLHMNSDFSASAALITGTVIESVLVLRNSCTLREDLNDSPSDNINKSQKESYRSRSPLSTEGFLVTSKQLQKHKELDNIKGIVDL